MAATGQTASSLHSQVKLSDLLQFLQMGFYNRATLLFQGQVDNIQYDVNIQYCLFVILI